MKKLLLFCLSGCIIFFPVVGYSLSLGELKVYSSANEPLLADIEILSLNPQLGVEDLDSNLASASLFKRFGIRRKSSLKQLRFTNYQKDGRTVVIVSSSKPFNATGLEFLLQVETRGEKTLKKYQLKLPRQNKAANPSPVATTKPVRKPAPTPKIIDAPVHSTVAIAKPARKPVASTPKVTDTRVRTTETESNTGFVKPVNNYYITASRQLPLADSYSDNVSRPAKQKKQKPPRSKRSSKENGAKPKPVVKPRLSQKKTYTVKRGDTLYKIAAATRQSGVKTDQMFLALFQKNSQFFSNRSINQLEIGDRLKVPSRKEARAVNRSKAKRFKDRLKQGGRPVNDYARKKAPAVSAKQKASVVAAKKIQPLKPKTKKAAQKSHPVRISKNTPQKVAGDFAPTGEGAKIHREHLVRLEQQLNQLRNLVKTKSDRNKQLSDLIKQKNRLLMRQPRTDEFTPYTPPDNEVNISSALSIDRGVITPIPTRLPTPKNVTLNPEKLVVSPSVASSTIPKIPSTTAEDNKVDGFTKISDKVYQGVIALTAWLGRSVIEYPTSIALFVWMLILSLMVLVDRTRSRYSREMQSLIAEKNALSEQVPEIIPAQNAQTEVQAEEIPADTQAMPTPKDDHDKPEQYSALDEEKLMQRGELQSSIVHLRENIYVLDQLSTELEVIKAPGKLQLIN